MESLWKFCLNKEGYGDVPFYCNCEINLLRRDCPYKKVKNKNTGTNTIIISISKGNCMMGYSTENPYENIDWDLSPDTNDNYYYYNISAK